MKNRPFKIILLFLIAALSQACGSPQPGGPESAAPLEVTRPVVNIGEEGDLLFLSREDFIDPELYSDFQEVIDTDVNEELYEQDQEALSLVRAFGDEESFSLVLLSNYAAQVLIQEGLLAELNRAKIPNLGNVAERFQALDYDRENRYCAPIQWSTTGVVFDADQTPRPEHWGALFTPDPASPTFGRIALLDNPREAFAAALLNLGYDVNTTSEKEIREAAQLLSQSGTSRFGFHGSNLFQFLASREVILAQGNSRELSPALESNQNLSFRLPQEGAILHVDNLCILKTAPAEIKSKAEEFINFILEPANNARLATYNFAASTISSGRDALPPGTFGEDFMYPKDLDLVPLFMIQPIGDTEQLYQDLYETIR